MKKVMILLAVVFAANVMMAQKKDRTDAFMYNKNGQYEKAMASIEKCINHEGFLGMKPNDQATAWLYRATIYQNVIQSGDEKLLMKAPDALEKVYESLMKCMENKDFLEENRQEIIQRVNAVMNTYYNVGAVAFDAGQYDVAIPQLKKAYDIAKSLGSPDANEMLKYAAFASMKAKDFDKAIEYYTMLQSSGYEGEDLYYNLASAYLGKENKEEAAKVISAGIAKFPSSEALIRENVNLKLMEGKGNEAVAELEQLLAARPDDVTLMFALGTIYGDDTKDMFDGDKAIDYYTRAINAKPDFYDAIYNLGALYINMSNKIKEQADAITGFSKAEQKQYEDLINQANELIQTGLPYVKQAYEAQPSPEIKAVLKSMYVRLNMLEEVKALEATE
jgi:tetratricopeptide (TPR) repeat protein